MVLCGGCGRRTLAQGRGMPTELCREWCEERRDDQRDAGRCLHAEALLQQLGWGGRHSLCQDGGGIAVAPVLHERFGRDGTEANPAEGVRGLQVRYREDPLLVVLRYRELQTWRLRDPGEDITMYKVAKPI